MPHKARCAVCGEGFIGRTPNAKYCSPPCRARGTSTRSKEYRAQNRDRVNAWKRDYHHRHGEVMREKSRQYYRDNAERMKANAAAYKRANPVYSRPGAAAATRKQRYGITEEQFDAMLESQEHMCAICDSVITADPVIDHCHRSGVIRGLLCRKCNTGIGMLGDDAERVRRAAEYLAAYESTEEAA